MICLKRITCYKSLGRATHRLRTAQVPYTGGQIPLMKPRYRGSHLFIPPTLPRSRQANNAIQPCCADAPNRNYIVEWKVFTRCAFTFLSPIYHNTQPIASADLYRGQIGRSTLSHDALKIGHLVDQTCRKTCCGLQSTLGCYLAGVRRPLKTVASHCDCTETGLVPSTASITTLCIFGDMVGSRSPRHR